MKQLLTIDGSPEDIQKVLSEAPVRGTWDGVEIPGYLITEETRLLDMLEGLELPALMVRSMPDHHTTQHLPDARTVARKPLIAYLREGVSRMAMFQLNAMCLDLGCGRIRPDEEAEAIDMRLRILRELMPLAEAHEVTVCLPVRVPGTTSENRAERLSEQILHELSHPYCKLVIDVILEEATEPPYEIFKRWPLTAAAVRVHYEPALGILPDEETLAGWLEGSGRAGYRGMFILSPKTPSPEALIAEIQRLSQIMA